MILVWFDIGWDTKLRDIGWTYVVLLALLVLLICIIRASIRIWKDSNDV